MNIIEVCAYILIPSTVQTLDRSNQTLLLSLEFLDSFNQITAVYLVYSRWVNPLFTFVE